MTTNKAEKTVTYTDLLRIRSLRDDRDTCRCPMCRHVTGHGSRGLVWSTFTADTAPIAAHPYTEESGQ